MELGKILEFKQDLYFEGAVQADWFYYPEKASKVAENFVFHGKQYFGVEEQGLGSKRRIDTISLVEELLTKLNDERSNALSLAIADYGTGKSHLAVTLAQLFSGSSYMPSSFNQVIRNIQDIDGDAAKRVKAVSSGRNFVMVINGMRDFNLHSEILKAAQKSLKLYGLSDDKLRKLNRAIETAEMFFERNASTSLKLFEKVATNRGVGLRGENLISFIKDNLLVDEEVFEIVNEVYSEINGQEIRWDEGLSATSILEMLVAEYCGMNGLFDHIIILFDEFGRYLEYTAGVNAAKSGESGLQQIFELTQKTQNIEGYLHVINFIQRDIKQYLETVDQTKNISRYIGRFDQSEKYYISSNLETVFANLIQRKDRDLFNDIIVKWQNEDEQSWKNLFDNMNKWLVTKGVWKDYGLFRKVVVEGIYPMHPLSTFMLTNLSDYLQNRSSLTLISNYIKEYSDVDVHENQFLIWPEQLIAGDLYTEMLAAEQEGRQKTQQCIKYGNVLIKYSDKLSADSLKVLRANLILRILRFRTTDYDDVIKAISICSGLSVGDIKEELKWLEQEYAVLEFDEHAAVFDFAEESNGAHDFKVIKKRLMANTVIEKTIIASIKIQELSGVLDVQTTNFGIQHKISTNEWQFAQELYPIEEFSLVKAKEYIDEWGKATSSTLAKGRLIWLYVNRDTNPDIVKLAQQTIELFADKPIVVMLLNDIDNRMFDKLVEFSVLDNMDATIRSKYERHFNEDFLRAENNLKDEIDSLKKQRYLLEKSSMKMLSTRIPVYLTSVFEDIYPKAVPFFFDGFVTNKNNISNKAAGFYCTFLKMFLSNSVSESTIYNCAVDMRNRVESLFSVTSATSWKCINKACKLIPPEEKNAKLVYDDIVEKINKQRELPCKDIYDIYCRPPFGMSEDVITLMVAVVCSNLNYCLRIHYKTIMNINLWKESIVTNNDKKVDLKIIKESIIVLVDAGAVTGKYMRFFDKVKNNKNISNVNELMTQLNEMVLIDEVPDELEQAYLLAQKTLESGRKAKNEWTAVIRTVEEKFEAAEASNNLYNAIVALEILRDIPFARIFDDNGYEYDEESKYRIGQRKNEITSFISSVMGIHLSNMYCKSVEGINTFRNHNTKIETKLSELGFANYAEMIRKKKEEELNNIEEIKSRQELRADYEKFILASKIDKHTTHVSVCALYKEAIVMQERILKYRTSLGRDSAQVASSISNRVDELQKTKDRVNQDMTDIWDDLYDLQSFDNLEDLLERINLILQKGISGTDQDDFYGLKKELDQLMNDIKRVENSLESRKTFETVSIEVRNKYLELELDFEVLPILDKAISEMKQKIDVKESEWRSANLTLGDKSRGSVHKFIECKKRLPLFLSTKTLEDIEIISQEANQIVSQGKIEDVIFYFEKLDTIEKKKCLEKLSEILG